MQQKIAGDFKEEVAEEENTEEQSALLAGDGQLSVHRQRRKPNVDTIEKGNNEEEEDKGKNPNPQFLNRPRPYRDRGDSEADSHAHLRARVWRKSHQHRSDLPTGRIAETICLEGDIGQATCPARGIYPQFQAH